MHDCLIDTDSLHALLAAPDLLLFDCRYALTDPDHGTRAYTRSHLPGARFIDLNRQLSAPPVAGRTGRHPLPTRAEWIASVAALGITPSHQVVVYDDSGGSSAARLWWMLKWIGHARVAVLDGGWQRWRDSALPLTDSTPAALPPAADGYSTRVPLLQLIEAAAVNGEQQLLLDARDPARFRGEVEPIDPVAGHIPGALCSPFAANLAADGRFKTAAALREKFAVATESSKPVVCYCGSGITACHNVLAMMAAGLPAPALYAGSWSEWITDPARPVATGP